MSFIKTSTIDLDEALVLQAALKRYAPILDKIVGETSDPKSKNSKERRAHAMRNLAAANDMLRDLDKMLDK